MKLEDTGIYKEYVKRSKAIRDETVDLDEMKIRFIMEISDSLNALNKIDGVRPGPWKVRKSIRDHDAIIDFPANENTEPKFGVMLSLPEIKVLCVLRNLLDAAKGVL